MTWTSTALLRCQHLKILVRNYVYTWFATAITKTTETTLTLLHLCNNNSNTNDLHLLEQLLTATTTASSEGGQVGLARVKHSTSNQSRCRRELKQFRAWVGRHEAWHACLSTFSCCVLEDYSRSSVYPTSSVIACALSNVVCFCSPATRSRRRGDRDYSSRGLGSPRWKRGMPMSTWRIWMWRGIVCRLLKFPASVRSERVYATVRAYQIDTLKKKKIKKGWWCWWYQGGDR